MHRLKYCFIFLYFIFFFAVQGQGQYTVNFDGTSDGTNASSYGFTNHDLNGVSWSGVQVIIPTTPLAADWFNGTRSLRSRGYGASEFFMTEDKLNGIGTLSFTYRQYGTDAQTAHMVEYSIDGGSNWVQIGSDFTGTSFAQPFSQIVNVAGSVRVRIRTVTSTGTSNRRLNIDDLVVTDYINPPTIALTSPTQVGSGTAATGATDVILSHFQADVSTADATLNSLQFTTAGTHLAADLTGNFKLYYGTTNVFGSASSIGNVAVGAPGSFTFTGLTQTITSGTTGYFWITANIAVAATDGRTINVAANPTLTFASGTPTGTIAAGGVKTISGAPVIPTVTTDVLTAITQSTATGGGNVTSDGNASVTARGVAFATTSSPTTGNSTTSNGTGTGTFTSSLSGLSAQTQYFVRAYATNSAGTAYGGEQNFRTLSNPPTAQASALSAANLTSSSIELSFTAATFPATGATRAGYVVLYHNGSAPVFSATNGNAPAASTGTIFTTSDAVLPTTPATTINVTGLSSSTAYQFLIIPYTWDGSNTETYHYLTAAAPTVSASTTTPPLGLEIAAADTRYTIDFDNTVSNVNNGQFDGSGFSPSPSAGQLNSSAWAVSGMSEAALDFGGTKGSGTDFSRGSSSGGVSTGGTYAFQVGTSNFALGLQPTGSDFSTNGMVKLRMTNNSGVTLTQINLSYLVYVFNDQGRSSSFSCSYSVDDVNYSAISAIDFVTSEVADGSPAWQAHYFSTVMSSISVADGAQFYVRWTSNDVGGSGSRDEFAIDDISIIGNPSATRMQLGQNIKQGIVNAPTNLTADVEVSESLSLGAKLYATAGNDLTIGSSANLIESGSHTVEGVVKATRTVSQNVNNTFGGIGIEINPTGNDMGNTLVTRTTGSRLTGQSSSQSLLRHFQVVPTTNTALSATVTFFYGDDDLIDAASNTVAEADLGLYKRPIGGDADSWIFMGYGTRNAANNSITVGGVANFSEIALADHANAPLPVELIHFSVEETQNHTHLVKWITATELNNDYFDIEFSANGGHFETVDRVQGAGFSNVLRDYSLEVEAFDHHQYYRLKQVDFDGKVSYSKAVRVTKQASPTQNTTVSVVNGNRLLLNNLSDDFIQSESQLKIEVIDLQGRAVAQSLAIDFYAKSVLIQLPSNLQVGCYILQLQNGKGESMSLPFIGY